MARIMIVVDHKWRDLPSSVYLKLLLEMKYNHQVELVRLGEDNALMSTFRPHAVVYNNLYETDRNSYARYLKKQGIKIIILPTEGITFSDQQTLLFTHKYSGIEFIDLYIAWNRLMYDAMLQYRVLPEAKICLAGNPRFDFYTYPLSNLLKTRDCFSKKYGMPPRNMNILITTNYANAEFWPDTSFLEKNLAKQRANGIPFFNDATKLARYEHDYRNKMFALIKEFSLRQDNVNILIKYHPSERRSLYRNFINELKSYNEHVYLIEGDYIWDVLNISDIVIQRCSTIAMESWLLGKHTVEIELMSALDHFLQPRYREGSWTIRSVDQLLELINTVQKETYSPDPKIESAKKNILEHLIFNPDGNTSKRIAAIIDGVIGRESADPGHVSDVNLKTKLKSIARKAFGMRCYDILCNLSKLKFGDYLGRYNKRFSTKDIEEWENKLKPYCE